MIGQNIVRRLLVRMACLMPLTSCSPAWIPALTALIALAGAPLQAGAADSIGTGPERGTYVEIGRNLAKWVAEPAGIDLTVLTSTGSSANVQRFRHDPSLRLALIQSDVYQAYLDEAGEGNADAAGFVTPLRVVMPLYLEEIYFIVRADSQMQRVEDIRGKRINIGPPGSGTALSATTVYRQLFGDGVAEKNASLLNNEEALRQLVNEKSVDVVVIVAGQPASLFANMRPEAFRYIKLLSIDPQGAAARAATESGYVPSLIRAGSYPRWLRHDVPALSTRALLVTHNQQTPAARQSLLRFAASLCGNFEALREHGHWKWNEVQLALPPLGVGWSYYAPTQKVLNTCSGAGASAKRPRGAPVPREDGRTDNDAPITLRTKALLPGPSRLPG